MGKRGIGIARFLAFFMLSAWVDAGISATVLYAAGKTDMRVESVCAFPPEFKAYAYLAEETAAGGVSVSYGDERLEVQDIVPYAESGEGTDYYLVLDVSGSVSASYFGQMKEAVRQFAGHMEAEDDLTLVTFGEKVSILLQQTKSMEELEGVLEKLENTDDSTRLFEALLDTAELAGTRDNAMRRKIALVLSDGEDFSQNTKTSNEAFDALEKAGIPLYAIVAEEMSRGRDNPYIDETGEFVRKTGGRAVVCNGENIRKKIVSLQKSFRKAYIITACAKSNRVDYAAKPFAFTFADGTVRTVNVTDRYYLEDVQAPTAAASLQSEKEIRISFSEKVEGADVCGNYQIRRDGEELLPVEAVSYTKDNAEAVLTLREPLENGVYQISFANIADISMEENAITDGCSLKVADGAAGEHGDASDGEESGTDVGKTDIRTWVPWIAAGGGVLVLSAVVGILIGRRRKRRAETVLTEGHASVNVGVNKKHHVAVDKHKPATRRIIILVEGASRPIRADVQQSIIIGRSDICDIYMDDEKMSRQHFILYAQGDGFAVEDLSTTNGTLVNGKTIRQKTVLANGDTIQAGDMKMVVKW